jgi:hypothetical protein
VQEKLKAHKELIMQGSLAFTAAVSFILSILEILADPEKFQWDLKVYYYSPLVFGEGLNPYKVSHFVYPPIYLPLFKIFSTLFSYDQFYPVFLFAKILCFFGLMFVWKKNFFLKAPFGVFLFLSWLGFYAAFLIDFQAGNISVFETALLFLAFSCFLKEWLGLFTVLVLCAASFKITPIFFLILLPLSSRQNWRVFSLGCLGFLSYGILNYLMYPEFTQTFFSEALARTGESGFICPSSLAFVTDVWTHFLSGWEFMPAKAIAKVTYLALASFILWRSWKSWHQAKGSGCRNNQDRIFLVLFSILVFTLAMPRMKDYAYMIAIPSLLYAMYEFEFQIPRWLLFLPLILIPPTTTWPPFFQEAFREFWSYYPLLLAALVWTLYLNQLKKLPRAAT